MLIFLVASDLIATMLIFLVAALFTSVTAIPLGTALVFVPLPRTTVLTFDLYTFGDEDSCITACLTYSKRTACYREASRCAAHPGVLHVALPLRYDELVNADRSAGRTPTLTLSVASATAQVLNLKTWTSSTWLPLPLPAPPVHPRRLGAAPLAAAGSAFNELARLSFAVRAGDTLHVAMRVLAGEEGSIIILAPGRLAAFRIDESKRVMVACTFAGNASVAWQVRTRRRAAGAAPSSAKHDDVVVRTTTAFIVHENSVSSSFSFRVEKHAHTPPRSTSKLK